MFYNKMNWYLQSFDLQNISSIMFNMPMQVKLILKMYNGIYPVEN